MTHTEAIKTLQRRAQFLKARIEKIESNKLTGTRQDRDRAEFSALKMSIQALINEEITTPIPLLRKV